MNEIWECRNCFKVGELDLHLKCPRCGSDSVIPQALIQTLEESHDRRRPLQCALSER